MTHTMAGVRWSTAELAAHYKRIGSPSPIADACGEKPAKRSKYGVDQSAAGKLERTCDGIMFDSTSEANAYQLLKIWLAAGAITDLRLQPVFTLQERFKDHAGRTVRSSRYTADFQFFDVAQRKTRYIDVKGVLTPAFKRAMLLMKDKHPGVEIEIWTREKIKEMSR